MAILKFKDENNQWQDLPALRGRDGVIQYQAGDGITINDNTISAEVPVLLSWDGTTGSTTAVKAFFQQVVDTHASGKDVFVVGRKANSDLVGELIYILRKADTVQTGSPYNYYKMLGTATASVSQNSYNHSSFSLTETNIHIYGQLVNGRFTVNNVITSEGGYQLDYLDTQGVYTAPYIPDRDDRPATKKYVDDAVAGAGGEAFPTVVLDNLIPFSSNGLDISDATLRTFFSELITDMLTNTESDGIIRIRYTTSDITDLYAAYNEVSTSRTQFDFYLLNPRVPTVGNWYALAVRGTWDNDTFSCTSVNNYYGSYNYLRENEVLTKTNTTAYTPTSNYHPATKKYIDDITGALTDLDTTDKTNLVNALNEVLAGSGGSDDAVKVLYLDNYSSSANALDMSQFETGLYIILRKTSGNTMYMKPRAGATARGLQNATGYNNLTILLYDNKFPETYDSNARSFTIIQMSPNALGYWVYTDYDTYFQTAWYTVVESVGIANNQTITGVKTFNALPTSSVTPTSNNQLVNKQYVDDSIFHTYSGTTDPSNDTGVDGDIYVKYTT